MTTQLDTEILEEIKEYKEIPYRFYGFVDTEGLDDGYLKLELDHTTDEPEPTYHFKMKAEGGSIGTVDFRVGYTEHTYLDGNVKFDMCCDSYEGSRYLTRALVMLKDIARRHRMNILSMVRDPEKERIAKAYQDAGAYERRIIEYDGKNVALHILCV